MSKEGQASPNQVSIADDADVEGLKKITEVIHRNGVPVLAQLAHAGRKAMADLFHRVSIRKYKDKPVEREKILENMWLMTDEIGQGGVWLGIAPLEDRMKSVEKVLNLPDTVRAFGIFAFGYPDEEKKQQDRFEEERIYFLQ